MAHIKIGFFSQALGMCADCNVILPQRPYTSAETAPHKTLWLLHGAYGDCSDWVRKTSIERYALQKGLAVVMPSAQMSGYADMAHGGKFFTYIADELPGVMRDFFRLSEKREDNFIAGLSMGGAGSLMIGLARPEQYAAIGCLSAGARNKGGSGSTEKWRLARDGDTPWEGTYRDPLFSAGEIVKKGLPAPKLYHAVGRDDFLLESAHVARDYFQSLPGNPFDYTYEEDEGAHTWEYWDAHIQKFLDFLALPAQSL